jgi:hypothetical protein
MINNIFNPNKNIRYLNVEDGKLLSTSEALFPRKINSEALSNCLSNGLFYMRKPGIYLPVAGLLPVPSRSRWNRRPNGYEFLESVWYKQLQTNPKIERLDNISRRYVSFLKGRSIAVELSGGLDTSLVIEFLIAQGAKLFFIGFISDEYEFRTELLIQSHYLQYAKEYKLIDYKNCNAFGKLLETPIHPVPVADSLYHFRGQVVAQAAKDLGVSLLLNGMAGDNLLGHSFIEIAKQTVPNGYDPWSMIDSWSAETIYKAEGITEISPFALHSVIRSMISLRANEAEDTMKLWARKVFSEKLPPKLSRFAYKANHDGWVADGLMAAEDDIKELLRTVLDVLPDDRLNVNEILSTVRKFNHASNEEQQRFLLKLSFLVWAYAYIREERLI